MNRGILRGILGVSCVTGMLLSSRILSQRQFYRFPPTSQLILRYEGLQDLSFSVAGMRSVGADMAWIQLLQFIGSYANPPRYPSFKDRTLRVTRLDPYFKNAYLFSSVILAWDTQLARQDEALDILKEGMIYNPRCWPLYTYAAAIGYKQVGNLQKMMAHLEKAVEDPDCPTVMKTVLANAYKKNGQYLQAFSIWEKILVSHAQESEKQRAVQEIEKLKLKLKLS